MTTNKDASNQHVIESWRNTKMLPDWKAAPGLGVTTKKTYTCVNVDTEPRASLNVVTFARKHCSLQGPCQLCQVLQDAQVPLGTPSW